MKHRLRVVLFLGYEMLTAVYEEEGKEGFSHILRMHINYQTLICF